MLTFCLIAGCESPKKGNLAYDPYPGSGYPPCLNIAVDGSVADSSLMAVTQWLSHADGRLADIALSGGNALTVTLPMPNINGDYEIVERNDTADIEQMQYWNTLRIAAHSVDVRTTFRGALRRHTYGAGAELHTFRVTANGVSQEFDWQKADTPTVVFRRGPWGRLMLKAD